MRILRSLVAATICFAALNATAFAADIPVAGKRLVVLDRGEVKKKVVFVVRDDTAGITKGEAVDVNDISAILHVSYGTSSTGAIFRVPVGAYDGTEGWKVNKAKRAHFVNKTSPAGSTTTASTTIRPNKSIQLKAKALGDDVVLDIFDAGSPAGSVFTAYCVDNGGEWNCYCSEFQSCDYRIVAKGTGARLTCGKPSVGDPTCRGLQPTALTASTSFDVDLTAGCESTL
jgi:hypothetical protein